jgi:hypothetical protein
MAPQDREGKQSFRSSIASNPKGEKTNHRLSILLRKVLKVGRNEEIMYSGTLIDDLIKTVEQAEKCSQRLLSSEEKLAHFYQVAQFEMVHLESRLAGVA